MELGQAIVKIIADAAGFTTALNKAETQVATFAQNAGAKLQSVGTNLTLGLTAPLVALGTAALTASAKYEQVQVAMTTMLGGSTAAADALLAKLTDLATRAPFQFDDIAAAAKSLLAFGTTADDIPATLTMIGDIAAGLNIPIGEMAELYGKAQVQGRLFAEDINQLTARGIPIIQELAKQFGVTDDEVRQLVEDGKVGFDDLEKAFQSMTSEGGQFAGMMDAQSKTLAGLWSTALDVVGNASRKIGDALVKNLDLKDKLKDATAFIEKITEKILGFVENNPQIVQIGIAIAGIAIAAGPTLFIIGSITSAFGSLLAIVSGAAFLPIIAAFGAVVAAGVLVYQNFDLIKSGFQSLVNSIQSSGLADAFQGFIGSGVELIIGIWQELQAAGEQLAIFFSTRLVPAFAELGSPVVEKVAEVAGKVFAALGSDGLPQLQSIASAIISQVVPALTALGEVLIAIGKFAAPRIISALDRLSPVLEFLASNFGIIVSVVGVVAGVIAAINAPILLVIGAIGLLAAAWGNNWGGIQNITKSAVDAVTGFFENISSAFSPIGEKIKSVWGTAMSGLETVTRTATDGIGVVFGNIGQQILQYWATNGADITEAITETWATIQNNANALWAGLTAVFEFGTNTLKTIVDFYLQGFQAIWAVIGIPVMVAVAGLWSNIQAIFSAAISIINAIINLFAANFSAIFSTVFAVVTTMAGAFWTQVGNIFQLAATTITQIVVAFLAIFRGDWQAVGAAVQTIVTAFWTYIQNTFSNARTALQSIITALSDFIRTAFTNLQTALVSIVTALWSTIQTIFNNAQNTLKATIGALTDFIRTAFSNMQSALNSIVSAMWNNIQSLFSNARTTLQSTINALTDFIRTAFSNMQSSLNSIVSAMWNNIQSLFSNAQSTLQSIVSSLSNAVSSTLSNMAGSARSTISGMWSSLQSAFSNGASAIQSTMQSAMNAVIRAIQNAVGSATSAANSIISGIKSAFSINWSSLGSNIASGIAAGLRAGAGAIIAAAKAAAQAALDAAKALLGIASPSRVFQQEVGLNIMRGWADGIASGNDILTKNITDAARAALAGANLALSDGAALAGRFSGGMVQSTQTETNTVNNYFSGYVSDEQRSVAQRVQLVYNGI